MSDSSFEHSGGYRAFRARVLNDTEANRRKAGHWHHDHEDKPHRYVALREQVQYMREAVRANLQPLLDECPTHEPHIRRVLRIPATVPLRPADWSALRRIGQFFIPLRLTWPQVRSVMSQVGTFEGRTYLYQNLYQRVLGFNSFGRDLYYCSSVDAALRYLKPPAGMEKQELGRLDPYWIRIARDFGLDSVAEVIPHARYGLQRLEGELAWILVQEKVITRIDEFEWLAYKQRNEYYKQEITRATRHMIRRMIRLILRHGIARQHIAGIFRHQISAFKPDRLDANLSKLKAAGLSDLSAVFETSKSLLWRAKPSVWSYVLDEIMARSPAQIARFKPLLQSSSTLPVPLVRLLKGLGATPDNLPQCQSLILDISRRTDDLLPLAEIQLLANPPHSLNIEQIARCTDYLAAPTRLHAFLQVLVRHGYASAPGVLAFQVCYENTYLADLDRWLLILGNRGKDQSLDTVAEWVRQALRSRHSDSYEYLIESIGLPDFTDLQRAEPVVTVGRKALAFLVERKGHTSLQAIRKWYFQAHGVHGLGDDGEADAIYILLLEDAYRRNNFAVVGNNQGCITNVVSGRITQQLGHRPYPADEATRDAWDQACAALKATEHAVLLPILPSILNQTGGLLLSSLLRHAWEPPAALAARLATLTPLINQLLAGSGPSGSELDELELEAVAMLYRTPTYVVNATWPQLHGCQDDLSGLTLRAHYTMEWDGSVRELGAPLEASSLLALGQAKLHANKFASYREEHIFDACKGLRAKRLKQSARDPWSLAAHLGVLFAAAQRDTVVGQWITQDLPAIVGMPQEGPDVAERLQQLDTMFSSTLPDALDAQASAFVKRFADADAAFLAARLVGDTAVSPSAGGQAQLEEGLRLTQQIVLDACRRWIIRERKKFSKGKSPRSLTQLNAIVSKHPASFFAKHAANLCTRDNTKMWHEHRHAHLVVFDPTQQRLAGMALVYVEPIASLHPTRDCLIIRAINPMADMLATHTTASIVDAFLDVAIQIASDNGLAAVAFPAHRGAHLLSNSRDVEKDIEKRYIKPSVLPSYLRGGETVMEDPVEWRMKPREIKGDFSAYEQGHERVNTLYAIWPGNLGA